MTGLRRKPRRGYHYIVFGSQRVRVPRRVQRWWEYHWPFGGHTYSHYPAKS